MTKTTKKSSSSKAPSIDLTAFNRDSNEKKLKEISYKELYLDPDNPRLAETIHTRTQASIQKVLEKEFDLQPIMDSLYNNGFFWEEPLMAVQEKLTETKKPGFVVVEGNRRLAALKYIHENPTLFPDKDARKRLEIIPVIVRSNRNETLSFLGFRHITGILGWESAAMAQYALRVVKGGNTVEEVAQLIGDKTKKIERLIRTQSIIEHANSIGIHQDDAAKKFFFSYLLTATDSPNTKKWLDLKVDESSGTVTNINDKNLSNLWSWLYGSKEKELTPAIAESRQISKLTRIIGAKDATKELEKTRNVERAYALTSSREEYAAEVLSEVRTRLQDMYATVHPDGPLEKNKDKSEFLSTCQAEIKKIDRILHDLKPLIHLK